MNDENDPWKVRALWRVMGVDLDEERIRAAEAECEESKRRIENAAREEAERRQQYARKWGKLFALAPDMFLANSSAERRLADMTPVNEWRH